MSGASNNQGRAYEFACLTSLHEAISKIRPARIVYNTSYNAAENAWNTLSPMEQNLYTLSAKSTIGTIFALEPNIIENTPDILSLYIQTDHRGEEADVRDIIIERKDIVWEIGLSIKHNHMAVKHSRIAKTLDFGTNGTAFHVQSNIGMMLNLFLISWRLKRKKERISEICHRRKMKFMFLFSMLLSKRLKPKLKRIRMSPEGWWNTF